MTAADKMPPLPDKAAIATIHGVTVWGRADDQMHAYARQYAAQVAGPLVEALQMLYDETADYIRLNNLGGMDNQCMRLARAALAAHKERTHG